MLLLAAGLAGFWFFAPLPLPSLPEETVRATGSYLMIYVSTLLLTALFLSFDGFDLVTNFTASLACISNVGPGFGKLAPIYTFSWMNPAAKLLLALEMLVGRLELYTILIIFLPSFWKK